MSLHELKEKLAGIKSRGFIETKRKGNTGVGYTLETLLEIEENNDAGADIEGDIELKAKRKDGSARITGFCQNPIWIVKSRDIVRKYGRPDRSNPERVNFYPSLRCGSLSPQGLSLAIEGSNLYLKGGEGEYLAEWHLEVIRFRFRQKHPNLVLVLAEREKQRGSLERFHYNEAYYCTGLGTDKIAKLIKDGKIVVEPRMYLNQITGKLRDRGVAFRLSEKWMMNLFDKVERLV